MLAMKLTQYANRDDVIVLGLPRGGVPVAFEVAKKLNAPLEPLVVRKLGIPGERELAMGAIASGNVRVLSEDVVRGPGIAQEIVDAVTAAEKQELKRREQLYRGHRPAPAIKGKTVLLIDDGIATGLSLRAAIEALRQQSPARLVVAVPTASPSSYRVISREVDELVALMAPEDFFGVGQFYEDFVQVTDAEVARLLGQASASKRQLVRPQKAPSHRR